MLKNKNEKTENSNEKFGKSAKFDRSVRNANRALELDLLRGFAVLLMVVDHFFNDAYDLMPFLFRDFPRPKTFGQTLVKFATAYWRSVPRTIAHYVVCFVFLSLTGICVSFSKSNVKRGLKLAVVALLITLATFILGKVAHLPNLTISFGILHCISLALIIIGLLSKFIKNKWFYLIVGLVMFGVGLYIQLNFQEGTSYAGKNVFLLVLEEIIGTKICGSDCFPFIFNGGQIFIGVFLGKHFYPERKSIFNLKYRESPLAFMGRNSLWVYIAHQIIMPLLFGAVLLCCGYHFSI